MNSESKLHHQQDQLQAEKSSQEQTGAQFSTAEEMLRHDSAQVEVPRVVAERLNNSLANEPKPAKSWWQRFVSGS